MLLTVIGYSCDFEQKIYSFTTENIGGYINSFDLLKKSLLTVGSSGDQAINAIVRGCKDITILDINPFIKYYFNLKKAGILALSYEEFIDYFHDYDLNLSLFNTTKGMIANVNPKFINCNILNVDKILNERKYDNIFLSNINDYINDKDSKLFQLAINYLMRKLNDQGKMMLAYIYNLGINGVPREFTNYDIERIRGVKKICFNYGSDDAIVTYQKTKK